MIGLFLRYDEMLVLEVGTHGAQGLGQEDGQGRDEFRIEPENDPFNIPGRPLQLRPVRFSRRNKDQGSRMEFILIVFHMVSIAV